MVILCQGTIVFLLSVELEQIQAGSVKKCYYFFFLIKILGKEAFCLILKHRGCLKRTLRQFYDYFNGKKCYLFLSYILVFPWSSQKKISVENKTMVLLEVSRSVTDMLYVN